MILGFVTLYWRWFFFPHEGNLILTCSSRVTPASYFLPIFYWSTCHMDFKPPSFEPLICPCWPPSYFKEQLRPRAGKSFCSTEARVKTILTQNWGIYTSFGLERHIEGMVLHKNSGWKANFQILLKRTKTRTVLEAARKSAVGLAYPYLSLTQWHLFWGACILLLHALVWVKDPLSM